MSELNETIKVIEREICITLVPWLKMMSRDNPRKHIRKTAKACAKALEKLID